MQSLCEYCEVIPLNSAELRSRKDDAAASWFGLGHLDRVINSKCPFCRLVTQAIHQDYIANPEDGVATSRLDPVNVVWSNDLGPGKRGAFYVYGVRKCIIYFAGDETQTTDGGDDDGFLRSSISPDLDYHRIGQWISSCEATHTVHCGDGYTPKQFSDAYPGLEVLRLIDVESYCLVRVQDVRRYVALSYVWGGVASVRLATSNLEQMLRINGIKAAWSRLPKTITDTILLAQKLQIRYVWVDALCLIQDDEDDLRRGINVMDNIYERAHLTVVAAYGHNANAGLPGIAKNSRMRTESIDVRKNIHMRVFMELDGMLDSTVYQTRGWT
ncbi:hypothetical protein CkaCkLH20_08625 [Colletotrichum karsti]|uniref:Heterokaryon incompatibility domain-containing protein n=1 Tax=Colletotrichum karsti TaxID=1095194 RepID=A0A9P6I4K8_9PEZI|nr:uncharacterized protein CkaCkLH20_08625 [Colletotrichum karsti]KAF9873891.1 hypothetical protein CkaCkLH20_08625 [Colletotrichum karsti]